MSTSCSDVCEDLIPLLLDAGFSREELDLENADDHDRILACMARVKVVRVCSFEGDVRMNGELGFEQPVCGTHGQFLTECYHQKNAGVTEALLTWHRNAFEGFQQGG